MGMRGISLTSKYPRNVGFLLLGMLTIANLFTLVAFPERGETSQRAPYADVTVSIETMKQIGVSHFSPSISNVDTSLFYPWGNNNQAAVKNAKSLIRKGLSFINQPIMAWGADDPWPDPTQAEPSNWSSLDKKLRIALETGVTPIITLCEAPWWMKGQLQSDGTTELLTRADDFADIAYGSRILDNKMSSWLHLVQRVAERYMVAPYNVRYFQVWNELKGYYNPITNNWDMSDSAGDPTGPNAKHGYTYMYNKVYMVLKKVAAAKGIDPATIKDGGPYVVMDTWSNAATESNPSSITKAYGNYDQRSLDAVTYWLQHKVGAEFITIDGGNGNKDGLNITDPFTASEKFADVVSWIRSLDSAKYPGATTLPIWWAEWYADSYATVADDYSNAIKSSAVIKLLKAGGAVALEWGGTGEGTNTTGLWTPTTRSDGGQPLPWYYSDKAFKDYFGPGTPVYETTSSSPDVEVLATPSKTMLVNKTANVLEVAVRIDIRNVTIKLNPYQVSVIDVLGPISYLLVY